MEKKIYPSVYRRLRSNAHIRSLVSPLRLTHHSFILPLFVEQDLALPRLIDHMHGIQVENKETIFQAIDNALKADIHKFLLFPIPSTKSNYPQDFSFAHTMISSVKAKYQQEIWVASDLCLCSYTLSGHCGILNSEWNKVLNDESIQILTQYATVVAGAGIDCIAPSDMMDGRIKAIRSALDEMGNDQTLIMSYSSKFSSQWYGPFRDACHSTPTVDSLKDRKSYQLSPTSMQEAIRSAVRDEQEGADILMVKPATLYTDVIAQVKMNTNSPVAAYHVSGEYAAIEALAHLGLLDRKKAHLEVWSSLQRSGVDIIISYAATHAKEWIETYEY